MTEISSASAETGPSVSADTLDAHTAAAFQTVLNALASVSLSGADSDTVAAFQTVLDAITSFSHAHAASTVNAVADAADAHPAAPANTPPAAADARPAARANTPPAGVGAANAPPAAAAAGAAIAPRSAFSPLPRWVSATVTPAPPISVPALGPNINFRTGPPWLVGELYIVIPMQHLAAIPDPPRVEGEETYWYCITQGRFVGVTVTHAVALAATRGVSGGTMKAHRSQVAALEAFNVALDYRMITVVV
ncbi:hypothetical protein R3P38DRAFT_3244018 [Favolaschia claudopus]|uniref:Uncharacterized protein n=1 Tax=Favolaschia claudopus TaxID=2862362 RepID=A0AAV9Z2A7_9AGAR